MHKNGVSSNSCQSGTCLICKPLMPVAMFLAQASGAVFCSNNLLDSKAYLLGMTCSTGHRSREYGVLLPSYALCQDKQQS